MTWFRVDDQLHTHRKACRAGAEAMGLWVMCGSYASSPACQGDGVLYDDEVERKAREIGIRRWQEVAERLVTVGLWDRVAGGYRFHDWDHYREGGDAILARRRAKDRERKWRERNGGADNGEAPSEVRPPVSADIPGTQTENSPHPPRASSLPDPSRPDQSKENPQPPPGAVSDRSADRLAADVDAVFVAWQADHMPKAKKTKDRVAKIRARLAEGYTVEQLVRASKGVLRSAWHMGSNNDGVQYRDAVTVFRSAAHVDKFLALMPEPVEPSAAREEPAPELPPEARQRNLADLASTLSAVTGAVQ